jgi:Flp pilus assembly protein TadB
MSTGVGVAVVAAILVVLPLGAVWLAGRWRDPPPERWGIPPEQRELAASALDVAEFRIRRDLRIRDEPRWTAVRRAVARGEAAPDDLRPAALRYARATIEAIDAQAGHSMWGRRPPPRPVRVLLAVAGLTAIVFVLVNNPLAGVVYLLYLGGLLLFRSRWWLTRKRARAQAAMEANR